MIKDILEVPYKNKFNQSAINHLCDLYNEILAIDSKIIVALDVLYNLHDQDTKIFEELRELTNEISSVLKKIDDNKKIDCPEYLKAVSYLFDLRRTFENGRKERQKIRMQCLAHSTTLKIVAKAKEYKVWEYNLFSGIYIYWEEERSILPKKITQETYLEI